ncbi:MAG: ABC transporter permease [Aeromicrobium sp.]|uniref:ABC transporter permease n=1 Tax=Aeromicrobium sp. TaxID=1871063 RepID=UPI0039E536FC
MSTATVETTAPVTRARRERAPIEPIPFTRLLSVELRKMFDTRAGLWLMISVVALSVIATVLTVLLGDRATLTFEDFSAAIGMPMSVILPMIGVLSVSSEWSQRTALTTFTLVPSRARVITAKLLGVVGIGVVSMLIAAAVGSIGTVVSPALAGTEPIWDTSLAQFAQIILANELGMLTGFMLGVLLRNTPAAIVAYFVYKLVIPGVSGALMGVQQWWAENCR